MTESTRQSGLRLAPAKVEVERRADGSLLLRSPQALGAYARVVGVVGAAR